MHRPSMIKGAELVLLAVGLGLGGCRSTPEQVRVQRESYREERVEAVQILPSAAAQEAPAVEERTSERIISSEPVVW